MKRLRDAGWRAQVVEKWIPHTRQRLDLFGCIDIIAIKGDITLGVQTTSASNAAASGFAVRENSAESLATVFAGNASRAEDASTVFNNPAGMSLLRGTQIEVGSAVVLPDMHFNGNATVQSGAINIDNGGITLTLDDVTVTGGAVITNTGTGTVLVEDGHTLSLTGASITA